VEKKNAQKKLSVKIKIFGMNLYLFSFKFTNYFNLHKFYVFIFCVKGRSHLSYIKCRLLLFHIYSCCKYLKIKHRGVGGTGWTNVCPKIR